VPKAAYRSDFLEKHRNFCPQRDSNLGPLAQQASVLPLRPLDVKAFDCVDHSILMQRLQSTVGLSGVVLDWIKSFQY